MYYALGFCVQGRHHLTLTAFFLLCPGMVFEYSAYVYRQPPPVIPGSQLPFQSYILENILKKKLVGFVNSTWQ